MIFSYKFLLSAFAFSLFAVFPVLAQEAETEETDAPPAETTAQAGVPVTAVDPAEADAADGGEADSETEEATLEPEPEPEKKKTPEELREEMLERLADQLSRRMRALKEREDILSAREGALGRREQEAEARERSLSDIEELMQLREDVVRRREKLPPPQSWNGPTAPSVYGTYAAVLDGETMQFYYKKNAETHTPVASTQKLVTALIVCNAGNLDNYAIVPEEVKNIEPTLIGVKPGEKYTRRQLLTSLLVRSGNDIAATLAIDNAGSIEAFAKKMNDYAKFIGMKDSNFVNPHGLPAKGQHSTARDIAIAAFEAYQIPDIREIIKLRTYPFIFNDGSERMLYNTNKVLSAYEHCNGMKTGFTYAAGNCLVSSASHNGEHRISVMIKSSRSYVSKDSQNILEWALNLEKTGPVAN